jgi:RNA polymerase sigma factor for flagellar operon FliA
MQASRPRRCTRGSSPVASEASTHEATREREPSRDNVPGSLGGIEGSEAVMETNVKAVELRELWRRYKGDGDEKARERLVVAYSPLVKFIAGRMASGLPAHVDEADLISYGLLGLIGAIERFDLEREIKFETFAVARIKGAIIDELRSLDWVPRSVRARARDVEKAHAALEGQLGRTPTDEEMSAKLDMSVEEFQDALLEIANSSVLALDDLWTFADPEGSGGQISVLDTIQDPNAIDPEIEAHTSELKDRLADAIESLPERERLVIALYYYENLTLREIGEVLGVTESRVSQLHTKAVLALRSRFPRP